MALEFITANPVTAGYEREATRRRQQRQTESAELGAMLQETATIQGLRRSNEEEARQMGLDKAGAEAFGGYQQNLGPNLTPGRRAMMDFAGALAGQGQGARAIELVNADRQGVEQAEANVMKALAGAKSEVEARQWMDWGARNGVQFAPEQIADWRRTIKQAQIGERGKLLGLSGEGLVKYTLEMERSGWDETKALANLPPEIKSIIGAQQGYYGVTGSGKAVPIVGQSGQQLSVIPRGGTQAGGFKVDLAYANAFDKALQSVTGGMTDDGVSAPSPYGPKAAARLRQAGHELIAGIGGFYTPQYVATVIGRVAEEQMITPEQALNQATLNAKQKFGRWASSQELGEGMTRDAWIQNEANRLTEESLERTLASIQAHFLMDLHTRAGTQPQAGYAPGTRGTQGGERGTYQKDEKGQDIFVTDQPPVSPQQGVETRPIPQPAAPRGTPLQPPMSGYPQQPLAAQGRDPSALEGVKARPDGSKPVDQATRPPMWSGTGFSPPALTPTPERQPPALGLTPSKTPPPLWGASSTLERVRTPQIQIPQRGSVTAEPEPGRASTTAEPEYGRDSVTAEPVTPLEREQKKPRGPVSDELSKARTQLDQLERQLADEERRWKELGEQVEIAQAKNEGKIKVREPQAAPRARPQASMGKPPEARFDKEAVSYTKEGLSKRIEQVGSQLKQTMARRNKALNKGNKGEAERLWKQQRNLQQEHGALMREQKRRNEAPKDPQKERAQAIEERIKALKRMRDQSKAQGKKEAAERQQGIIDRLFNEQMPIIESIRKREKTWAPD